MVIAAAMKCKTVWRLVSLACVCWLTAACVAVVVHEERSAYSHIRVVDRGPLRALYFLGDADLDVVETVIDRSAPHRLQHAYARAVMAALLYRPEAASGLLVGLGGGAMVRFLNHSFPQVRLDVVEIDPAVVGVAARFFGAGESANTRIHVADGREFLERDRGRYDIILIDAHLHPGTLTDSVGHPASLKSERFFRAVADRLSPGGVVMFNVLSGRESAAYLDAIGKALGPVHRYLPPDTGNIVVFASPHGPLPGEEALRLRAQALDRRGGFGFSFEELLAARSR